MNTVEDVRVVQLCLNATGADLPLWTAVELTGLHNDRRVKPVTAANSTKVIGSVIGYWNGFRVIEDDCPDGSEAVVLTQGVARFLIDAAVTRLQYAFTSTTDGTIVSSATPAEGAFGIMVDSADPGEGHTYARVLLPLAAALVVDPTTISHDDLTGVDPDDHHSEAHDIDDTGVHGNFPGDPTLYLDGSGAFSNPTGSGAGFSWTQDIDEDGSSFANWSAVAGSWSSSGTKIQQTDSTSAQRIAKLTSIAPRRQAVCVLEFQFEFIDTASFAAAYLFSGGNNSNGWQFGVDYSTHLILVNQPGATAPQQFTYDPGALSTATTYRLGAIIVGDRADIFWNGSFVGTAALPGSFGADQSVFGLIAWKKIDFHDIKGWVADLNDPF